MTYWSARQRRPHALLAGFSALLGSLMVSYPRARMEAEASRPASPGGWGYVSRDIRLLIAAVGSMTGRVHGTLILLAVLTNASVVWRLAELRKRTS